MSRPLLLDNANHQVYYAASNLADDVKRREQPSRFGLLAKSLFHDKAAQDDEKKAGAAVAGLCGCLCVLLLFGSLFAGTILVVYGKGIEEGVNDEILAGRILLVIFASFLTCFFVCACSACCAAGAMGGKTKDLLNSDAMNNTENKFPNFVFKRLNDNYKKDIKQHAALLEKTSKTLPKTAKELLTKQEAKEKKERVKKEQSLEEEINAMVTAALAEEGMTSVSVIRKLRPTCYVIDFDGDMNASQVDDLREMITLILLVATPYDQVLVRLTSPGGTVTGYGLAASQLMRIKHAGMRLTVCIDQVAASGGYMMACVADHIVCAPFAMVGSIGVIAYVPNFHRLLEKNNVDVFNFHAGEWKRTVDFVGPVTEEGKKKLQEELTDIHNQFKAHVKSNRPSILDVDKVATGEAWLGDKAKEFGLVDQIGTSDDFLLELSYTQDIFKLTKFEKKKFILSNLIPDMEDAGSLLLRLKNSFTNFILGLFFGNRTSSPMLHGGNKAHMI